MTERKRTYQSKTQAVALRRLSSISTPLKPDYETELARQNSLNPVEKIDLLNRLIKHLKTL
jgi:hypothetical protein